MPDEDTARLPSALDRLRVTVTDVATGEVVDETVIYDDYLLICAGHPYLANTRAYANGTHVLTVKNAGPWRAHHAVRNQEATDV